MEPEIVRTNHKPPHHALRRVVWFVLVGSVAALVHFCVVWALVRHGGMVPLAANVAGWAVAFGVSFCGHYFLTFRQSAAPLAQAARRFALLSATGFAINECAYALLLNVSTLPFDVALAVVLVGVAVITYLLSSSWAFSNAG